MRHTQKLRENYLFKRLYRRGKSSVGSFVVLYYHKAGTRPYNRLGITTTKKVGCAVLRNRARRVIAESYRLLESEIKTGYDLVIVARSGAANVKMQTVKADLQRLLSKIGGIQTPAHTRPGRQKEGP